MTKAHACAYCGAATSEGPHLSLKAGWFYPACCAADACLDRWEAAPIAEASPATRWFMDISKDMPPSGCQQANLAAERIAMARGWDLWPGRP